jgi:ABC-2 type transport system permease protein
MFKLIKYELRATILNLIGICAIVTIANLFLMTRKNSWDSVTIMGLSATLIIGAVIVIFFASLKIMSKYLYDDSGYLLFTLPQSGVSIVGSRLLTALIEITIVVCVSISMFYLNTSDQVSLASFFKGFKPGIVIFNLITYIWGIIYLLTLIYFCMVIGKVALKGKKIGKIGTFIIFVLLILAIGWLSNKIKIALPQNLNLADFSINKTGVILNSDFSIASGQYNISIAQTIFQIIIFAGLFMSTSLLIDKKLDLS